MADLQNGNAGDHATERTVSLSSVRNQKVAWARDIRGGWSKEIANAWSLSWIWCSDTSYLASAMLSGNVTFKCLHVGPRLQFCIGHHPVAKQTHACFPGSWSPSGLWKHWLAFTVPGNKMVRFCTSPPLHRSSLLTSVTDSKDYLPRWTLSTSNNKNVYSSSGATSLFRNIKITINTLVFSPTKEQMGNLLKHLPPQTEIHKGSGKAHFVILTLIYIT